MDGAFNAAGDRQFLRDDLTQHLCALSDHDGRGLQLAFDVTKNCHGPVAGNLPNNRKTGTDGGHCFRSRRCRDSGALHLVIRGSNVSILFRCISFGFSKHVTLLLLTVGSSKLSVSVVDTAKTVTKMTEHFTRG